MQGIQVRPDQTIGRYRATISGSARIARVEVDVAARESQLDWMPSGRHLGLQWSNASLTMSASYDVAPTPFSTRPGGHDRSHG